MATLTSGKPFGSFKCCFESTPTVPGLDAQSVFE